MGPCISKTLQVRLLYILLACKGALSPTARQIQMEYIADASTHYLFDVLLSLQGWGSDKRSGLHFKEVPSLL